MARLRGGDVPRALLRHEPKHSYVYKNKIPETRRERGKMNRLIHPESDAFEQGIN